MPSNPPIASKSPEIKCPECQNRISADLVTLILKGTTVYCERCGFAFVGIDSKGDVKDLSKETQFKNKDTETQERLKDQWAIWKQQWQELKTQISTNIKNTIYLSHSQPVPSANVSPPNPPKPSYQNYRATNPAYQASSFSNPPVQIPSGSNSYYQKPISPNNLLYHRMHAEGIYHAVCTLSTISIIFYIFSLIGLIISTIVNMATGNFTFFAQLGTLIIEIAVIQIDTHQFMPQIRTKTVPHAGFGLLLVGIITLSFNGIGIFLLIRGILYIIYTMINLRLNNSPVLDPTKIPLHTSLITKELIEAFTPLLSLFLPLLFVSILFNAISGALGSYIPILLPFAIIAGIFLLIALGHLSSTHNMIVENIEQGLFIRLLVFGIIMSIFGGLGSILIAFAIIGLIFVDAKKRTTEPILPLENYLSNAIPSVPPTNIISHIQNTVTQTTIPQDTAPKNTGQRIRRFDPETGEPYLVPISEPIPYNSPIPQPPPVSHPKQPTISYPINPQNILTVLDPDVHEQLFALPLSDQEKIEIGRNLLYLAKREQLKYLHEFQAVNQGLPPEMQANIDRLNRLSLSEKDRKSLIQQLEYLPLQKQNEFVAFIEASVRYNKI